MFTGRDAAQAAKVIAGATGAEPAQFLRFEYGGDDAAAKLKTHAKGAAAIIHCAALASPWGPRAAFTRANIASTREVLAACEAHAIRRLVHIQSKRVLYF